MQLGEVSHGLGCIGFRVKPAGPHRTWLVRLRLSCLRSGSFRRDNTIVVYVDTRKFMFGTAGEEKKK